jgi:hypothetical protein
MPATNLNRSIAQAPERPPYLAAAVFTAIVLTLYVLTIAPTTQFWDTSEYIAAAKVLGIPHPPGNPLFVLVAHVWAMLPLADTYALRINLLAASTTAAATGFLFLVTERMLRSATDLPSWVRRLTAGAGSLVGAASFTVWNQATVNEKTYSIGLLSITLVMWLAVRWADTPPSSRDRYLVLIAYLLTLTMGNHLMGLLGGPLVAVYLLYTEPGALLRGRLWVALALAVLVGLTVWIYLPIRAAHYPPINEGEPTTWAALKAVLNRDQYQKPPITFRQADFVSQLGNYLQYYQWQYARDWGRYAGAFFAALFGAMALTGLIRQWQRDRRAAAAMLTLMFTITVVLIYYLDFKYGFSYRPGDSLEREVRERDYFFEASFLLWGVWIAMGLAVMVEALGRGLAGRLPDQRRWHFVTPALALCLIPVLGNRVSASRAGETVPRDFAIDILQSVEPYAILITAGDNDTFPLWYAQEVEGVRKDVIIANQSLMRTDWHLRQINRRPTLPFDSAQAAPPYHGRSWPVPAGRPLSLTDQQLDALPEIYPLTRRSGFRVDSLAITIEPRELYRDDLATLQLIRDNLGKRPIYFSRTTGGYPDDMGFTPYLLTQGLARKLMPAPIRPGPGVVFDRRLGWMDVARTQRLLFGVYHSDSVARRRPLGWIDRPSESMLVVYGLTYAVFADVLKSASNGSPDGKVLAGRAETLAQRIFANTSFAAGSPR